MSGSSGQRYALTEDSDGVRRVVELGVVHARGDDVVHRVTPDRGRDEASDEQPGQRRIAVGEVEDVRGFAFRWRGSEPGARRRIIAQPHAAEAGAESIFVRTEGGDRVDARAPEVGRHPLEVGHRVGGHADDVEQVVAIAHTGEPLAFLRPGQPRQVVVLHFVHARDVASCRVGQRRPSEDLRPGLDPRARRQVVRAEGLLVEEDPVAEVPRRPEVLVERRVEPPGLHADLGQERLRHRTVVVRPVDRLRPAVAK
jgi:hypothetical protein